MSEGLHAPIVCEATPPPIRSHVDFLEPCPDTFRAAIGKVLAPVALSAKTSPGSSGKALGPAMPSLTLAGVMATTSTKDVPASVPTCALNPRAVACPYA